MSSPALGNPMDSLSLDTIFLSNSPNELDEPNGVFSIVEPNENDVLLGRGGRNNRHTGNNVLRQLARGVWQKYHAATKREKPLIAEALVENIRDQSPSGRFLKFEPSLGEWQEVPYAQAREKACQCLRDTVAIMIKAKKDGCAPPPIIIKASKAAVPSAAPVTEVASGSVAAAAQTPAVAAHKDTAPKKPQRSFSRRDSFPPVRTVSAELEDMASTTNAQSVPMPTHSAESLVHMTLQNQHHHHHHQQHADLEPIVLNNNSPSPMDVSQSMSSLMQPEGPPMRIPVGRSNSDSSAMSTHSSSSSHSHYSNNNNQQNSSSSMLRRTGGGITPGFGAVNMNNAQSTLSQGGFAQQALGMDAAPQQQQQFVPQPSSFLVRNDSNNMDNSMHNNNMTFQEQLLQQQLQQRQQQQQTNMFSPNFQQSFSAAANNDDVRAPDFETKPYQRTFFSEEQQQQNSGIMPEQPQQLQQQQNCPSQFKTDFSPSFSGGQHISLHSAMGLNAIRGLKQNGTINPPQAYCAQLLLPREDEEEEGIISDEALEGITWEGADMGSGAVAASTNSGSSNQEFRKTISQLLDEIDT